MPNRLTEEASPYLLQHAENPVDWYPWGEEALTAAAERDVPILLSIGYSSCHWCHVMAHESFEDHATAAYMNEHFVPVKVDREERPDIDAIYMEAAQAMSGHGGWPLTAFLTPQQVPFFAGTYFPPTPRPNMPSFMQLMQSVNELWRENRQAIEERSGLLVEQLQTTARLRAPEDPLSADSLTAARAALQQAFDAEQGGFGGAPKFPPHSVLEFLLASPGPEERQMALVTLRRMALGGIHDQLAGGFSRYSVDDHWRIPHFEKMLYDNALLARAYLHAFLTTGEAVYADVARSTLDWMLRDLHAPGVGFASALDADSPNADGKPEEGAFYAWHSDELLEVLNEAVPDHGQQLMRYWGVVEDGEFEGANVLRVDMPGERPPEDVLEAARVALLARRQLRAHPARDDKRITSWNALALAALAEAGAVLGEASYIEAATATADFIERELTQADGRLLRSWSGGRRGGPGFLDDHAYTASALITLYEATADERWFVRARELCGLMLEHFEDAELGGFFSTAADHEELLVRRKDIEDNPIPGGNSAAALALLRMAALTGEDRYRAAATRTLQTLQRIAARMPLGFGCALQGISLATGPTREVALVGPAGAGRDALLRVLRGAHRPDIVLAVSETGGGAVPLLEGRGAQDGRAAAYVCRNFACELPVTTPGELAALLED